MRNYKLLSLVLTLMVIALTSFTVISLIPLKSSTFKIQNSTNLSATTSDFRDLPKISSTIQWIPNGPVIQWTPNGTLACNATNDQQVPQLCPDGQGGAIITWADYRNGTEYDIYAQRVNSLGARQWIPLNGTVICNETGDQANPQICSDGQGGAIISWQDSRDDINDIYAQRVNSTGDIQWQEDGIVICNAINQQQNPQICSDGQKGVIITWQDLRSDAGDIYAQCVNSTGARQWIPLNGIVICNINDQQQNPQICSDGQGNAIFTWTDYRSGTIYGDIYAQYINATGDTKWRANGTVICNATDGQQSPKICSDGQRGAIITWTDMRSITWANIYAQRVNSTGDMQWMVNGTEVCIGDHSDNNPQICSDGQGGAIITWEDNRGNSDIYAQHVNSTGNVTWIYSGVVICNATDFQETPQICSDGQGGAIITWEDPRYLSTNGVDIYAQRVNSTGSTKWMVNGTVICNATTFQGVPRICTDNAGSAIITWEDYRSETIFRDIYAQRLTYYIIIPSGGGGGGGSGGGGGGGGKTGGGGSKTVVEETPVAVFIPGYDLIVLIGVACVASMILIKKFKKT